MTLYRPLRIVSIIVDILPVSSNSSTNEIRRQHWSQQQNIRKQTNMRIGDWPVPPVLLLAIFVIVIEQLHSHIGSVDASIPVGPNHNRHRLHNTNSYTANNNDGTHQTSTNQQPQPQHRKRKSWTKEAYLNPMIHPVQCRSSSHGTTTNTRRICDPDGALSSQEIQVLEAQLLAFSNNIYHISIPKTQNPAPVQIEIYIAFVGKVCFDFPYLKFDFASFLLLC